MKVKAKKEVSTITLLEMHYANEIETKTYVSNNRGIVSFKPNGLYDMKGVTHEDKFDVEYEDELTLDTRLASIAHIWTHNDELRISVFRNHSIQDFIDSPVKREPLILYKVNDDGTLTMIYRDGEICG